MSVLLTGCTLLHIKLRYAQIGQACQRIRWDMRMLSVEFHWPTDAHPLSKRSTCRMGDVYRYTMIEFYTDLIWFTGIVWIPASSAAIYLSWNQAPRLSLALTTWVGLEKTPWRSIRINAELCPLNISKLSTYTSSSIFHQGKDTKLATSGLVSFAGGGGPLGQHVWSSDKRMLHQSDPICTSTLHSSTVSWECVSILSRASTGSGCRAWPGNHREISSMNECSCQQSCWCGAKGETLSFPQFWVHRLNCMYL